MALVLLALIFCALRLIGLDHGRPPLMFHADERHYAGVAARMSWSDLDPHRFENPPLLTYALFGASEARGLVWGAESNRRWINQGGLYRLSRILSALLGAATAFVVAAAARRLGGDRAGLAALLVVGFSFLHGRDSHFGVNDVPMTFLVAVVTWMSLRVLAGDGRGWAWAAAVCAGLAAATKYNGAIAVALPVLAVVLASQRPANRIKPLSRFALAAALPAVSLLTFLIANPFALLSWDDFSAGVVNQFTRWGDSPSWGQSREALPLLYGQATGAMLGIAHGVAAAWGVLLVIAGRRRTAALLLAFPLLYLAGMLTKPLFFWRFVLPLLPALAVLAGLGWDHALSFVQRLTAGKPRGEPTAERRPALGVLSVVALLGGSVWPCAQLLRLDQLLLETPTWLQAREWILEHQPPGGQVFAAGLPPSLPPGRTMHSLSVHLPRVHLVKNTGDTLPAIERGGLVITNCWVSLGGELEENLDERRVFLARLEQSFKLVAEFSPGPQGDAQPHVLDSLYAPLVDLWSIERPGHTLRVYRVPPRTWLKNMMVEGAGPAKAEGKASSSGGR